MQEILNHVLSDVELFLGQVAAAAANDGKIKKKKGSKKKDSKKKGTLISLSEHQQVVNQRKN